MKLVIQILGCVAWSLTSSAIALTTVPSDRDTNTVVDATGSGRAAQTGDLLNAMPLAFEENRGQFDRRVRYLARAPGYTMFLAATESTMVLDSGDAKPRSGPAVLRLRFAGASRAAAFEGRERLDQVTNYFAGGRTPRSYTSIPNYAKVAVRSIYPGVDVVYYGNRRELEYDLIVAPRADPNRIAMQINGATGMSLTAAGDLLLGTTAGNLVLRKPVAYQEADGQRVPVAVDYAPPKSNGTVRFRIADYDHAKPLVIDPILSYSTGLGGTNGAKPHGIAVDAGGHAYIVGATSSTDFPTANAYQTRLKGASDVFVTKFNAAGTGILYSTYLGGSKSTSEGTAIAVDANGNAYVTGTVSAATFPVTSGAYQTTGTAGSSFVTKLGPLGNTLLYSTYLNGAKSKTIAVDAGGNAYVAGGAASGFLATTGALQTVNRGANNGFVVKLNATGSAPLYATFLGGSATDSINGIALDPAGNAYVAGDAQSADFPVVAAMQPQRRGASDAFAAKIGPAGDALIYSTYLGGSDNDSGKAVAVNADGNAHVVGVTYSRDFPITWGAFQTSHGITGAVGTLDNAFITKLDATGRWLVYSSYLGGRACLTYAVNSCTGPSGEGALAVAVDRMGNAYLAGYSASVAYGLVDPLSRPLRDNNSHMPFVAKVRPDGQRLAYATVLGQDDSSFSWPTADAVGIALDGQGSAYVTGNVVNTIGYPITAGAFQTKASGFVAKLSPGLVRTRLASAPLSGTCQESSQSLTAEISDNAASGTVTFYNGATPLGTTPVALGKASLTTILPVGIHALTAVFSGDGKASPTLYEVVALPAVCN